MLLLLTNEVRVAQGKPNCRNSEGAASIPLTIFPPVQSRKIKGGVGAMETGCPVLSPMVLLSFGPHIQVLVAASSLLWQVTPIAYGWKYKLKARALSILEKNMQKIIMGALLIAQQAVPSLTNRRS